MNPHVTQIQRSSHAALRSQPWQEAASSHGESGVGDGGVFGDFDPFLLLLLDLAREFCLADGAMHSWSHIRKERRESMLRITRRAEKGVALFGYLASERVVRLERAPKLGQTQRLTHMAAVFRRHFRCC